MNSEYLESLTYDQARDLYNQHGTSMFLKTLFSTKTDYNHTRLLEELSKLPLTTNHQPLTTNPKTLITNQQPLNPIITRRRYLYKLSADNHAKLKALFLTTPSEAKAKTPSEAKGITADFALAILNNFDEIKNIWDATNHYDTTNQLPEGITITPEGKIQPTQTESNEVPPPGGRGLGLLGLSDLQLNTQFQKHYKYITRYKSVPTAAVELANRQSICHAIATELISRGTFQYPNHNYMLKQKNESQPLTTKP